jgi:hypothetical protein
MRGGVAKRERTDKVIQVVIGDKVIGMINF